MLGNHVRRHLWVCCTNCCTDASLNPLKCTKTDASHLYFTTTYARLGLFVIGRPRVQLSPSAPEFVGSSPIYEEENSDASQSARWRWLGQIVTSEMVLTELLNSFSDYGPRLRQAAARAVASLRDASEI